MAKSADPELQRRAGAPYGASVSICVFAGADRGGTYKVFADMTSIACGAGASPIADGLDGGGPQSGSKMCIPDVESYEQAYPVLYLYRRLAKDSGGAGQFRGGVGLEAAWTPWGTDKFVGITNAAGWQIPVPGFAGGYPGGATEQRRVRGSTELIPASFDPAGGESIEAKAKDVQLRDGDIWYMRYPGGGGWGDPLDRDPALVVNDIRLGAVGNDAALAMYGVVLSASGYDLEATHKKRDALRAERLVGGASRRGRLSDGLARFGAYVSSRDEVELSETFDPKTGRTLDVGYTANAGANLTLPPAAHRIL
jgi:N-methylhydantoinase B